MTDNGQGAPANRPPASPEKAEKDLLMEQRVGRFLGKAFWKAKQTRIWQKTARAYREGLEGEDKTK